MKQTISQLIDIANEFINEEKKSYEGNDISRNIHDDLQSEVRKLYSHIKNKIEFETEQSVNDSVANMSAPTQKSTGSTDVSGMFPKFYRKNLDSPMECTLASAILKLALEEAGFEKVYTAIITGHQVTLTEKQNGSITIYDPSTRYTGNDGITHGFSHNFDASQISERQEINDQRGNYRGYKFRVETAEKPAHTGMFEAFDNNKNLYYRDFFASEPNTLIELSVVLYNLDNLPSKNLYPSLNKFDAKKIVKNAGIFDWFHPNL